MLNGGEMLSLEGRRRRGHIWSLQQPRRIGFGRMSLRTVAGALVRRRGIAVPRVLLHEPLMPLVPWFALRQAAVPVVATFHTHREGGHRWYGRYQWLLAPLMRRLDHIWNTSPEKIPAVRP